MSSRPILFDVTRLSTRGLRATPNGIDRVDLAFAQHFLQGPETASNRAIGFGLSGVKSLTAEEAGKAVASVGATLGENRDDAAAMQIVSRFLRGEGAGAVWQAAAQRRFPSRLLSANHAPSVIRNRMKGATGLRAGAVSGLISAASPFAGRSPRTDAPLGAVYINVSQFPIWMNSYFRWMDGRPDVKPVFFIHDVLPLDFPEYFPDGEPRRHSRRLEVVARRAAGVIVSTRSVRDRLLRHLPPTRRGESPIHVGRLPTHPVFSTAYDPPSEWDRPYFVVCGTIEPRKNHILLLHVWRQLVEEFGEAAPKLVVIGSRGWKNQHVVQLLETCPGFRHSVLEISGLGTPSLKRLFDGARALLMPSFGEGFGLPVAEGLAAGVPVIAADIAAFREIGEGRALLLDPLDGPGWKREIIDLANAPRHRPVAGAGGESAAPTWTSYFRDLEEFIDSL